MNLNVVSLSGLDGGMYSTECHSSFALLLKTYLNSIWTALIQNDREYCLLHNKLHPGTETTMNVYIYSTKGRGPAYTEPTMNHRVVYLSWRKTLGCTSRLRPLCVGPSQGAPWSERCGLPTTTYITEGTGTIQHYSMHTHINTTGCTGRRHTAALGHCRDALTNWWVMLHLNAVRICSHCSQSQFHNQYTQFFL